MANAIVGQRKSSATRKAQLMEVASKVFVERGYKETGIEAILSQAGLTGPALYRHFASKQEILDTICISAVQRTLDVALEVRDDEALTPREKLDKLIDVRLDYLFGPSGTPAFLATSQRAHISDDARNRVLATQRESSDIIADILAEIRSDLDIDQLRLIFFAVQNMALYSIWRSRNRILLSDEEHKVLLKKMIWGALMAPFEPSP